VSKFKLGRVIGISEVNRLTNGDTGKEA